MDFWKHGYDIPEWVFMTPRVQKSIPASPLIRAYRIKAHESFDRLWKDEGPFTRGEAYAWLAGRLNIPHEGAHIGLMVTQEELQKVIDVCNEFIGYSPAGDDFGDL